MPVAASVGDQSRCHPGGEDLPSPTAHSPPKPTPLSQRRSAGAVSRKGVARRREKEASASFVLRGAPFAARDTLRPAEADAARTELLSTLCAALEESRRATSQKGREEEAQEKTTAATTITTTTQPHPPPRLRRTEATQTPPPPRVQARHEGQHPADTQPT